MAMEKVKAEYSRKERECENSYQSKTAAVYVLTLGSLLYGFLITVLQACFTERFSHDFVTFILWIWNFVSGVFSGAVNAAEAVWQLKEKIPYQILDVTVAGLLAFIVALAIVGVVFGLVGFVLFKVGQFYKEEFWDLPSLVVALVSLALLIWLADYLAFIKWNLMIIWLLIHVAYVFIRMMVSKPKSSYY